MNVMKTVAVVTATYNRAELLETLFSSLLGQTSKDFVWYIIDDGSSDNTEKVVQCFGSSEFEIRYIKKDNGGRHTALNVGIQAAKEALVFPVDSDDWLAPDAIDTIVTDWKKYETIETIAGLSYYKMLSDGKVISVPYPGDHFSGSFIDVRVNQRISGDSAEIFRTTVLKKYPFPEIQGEKFLSEVVVWHAIAQEYKLVYIPKGIYYCEYREDGLSKSGRLKQLNSPQGTLLHAKAYMYKSVVLPIRSKYCCMYIAVAKWSKTSMIKAWKESGAPVLFAVCFVPGLMLYWAWRRKYRH